MPDSLTNTPQVQQLLNRAAGLDQPGGNERLKRIVHRVVTDLCPTIEEFDVTPTEFWTAVHVAHRVSSARAACAGDRTSSDRSRSRALP